MYIGYIKSISGRILKKLKSHRIFDHIITVTFSPGSDEFLFFLDIHGIRAI